MKIKPLRLIQAIFSRLGQLEWPMSSDGSDYYLYSVADVVQEMDCVIRELFLEALSCVGADYETYEDITFGTSTEEATMTEQKREIVITRAVITDSENYTQVDKVDYGVRHRYFKTGKQRFWFRQHPSNGNTIGLVEPESITTLRVYFIPLPRILVGGLGVSYDGSYNRVYIPHWGPSVANYYTVNVNKVHHAVLVNNQLPTNSAVIEDAILVHAADQIKFYLNGVAADGSSDDRVWCVEPEWAPHAAQDYIVKEVANRLKEGRDGSVSDRWLTMASMAKAKFFGTLNGSGIMEPESLEDWMN